MICLPLIRKEQLLGVMQVINKMDGGIFDPDDLALFQTLAAQCAVAIDNHLLTQKLIRNETLERELEVAREIQQNILPKSLPHYPDLDIGTRLIPAHQVGGDYFNIIRINDTQSLFVIADVAGKGIPAALIVSTLDACLHSYLKIDPERFDMLELVGMMNRVLIDATIATKFVTAWFGLYDHSSGQWTTVNAGHMPPIFWCHQDSEVAMLKEGGILMGSVDVCYECHRFTMEKNDVLVYYTDGVTEAWNIHEEDYGDDRLVHVISKYKHGSAAAILAAIEKDVKRHVGNAIQSDDMTCVVIKKN
jgi:sigma-B regulation protein RsbU (phosphoserine phosphatase)